MRERERERERNVPGLYKIKKDRERIKGKVLKNLCILYVSK